MATLCSRNTLTLCKPDKRIRLDHTLIGIKDNIKQYVSTHEKHTIISNFGEYDRYALINLRESYCNNKKYKKNPAQEFLF